MMLNHAATKLLVKNMLLHPQHYDWTLQGFGMLRTYLDADRVYRLHIWSQANAVENVSEMHTHPWGFRSLIVAGEVENRLFSPVHFEGALPGNLNKGTPYQQQLIKCGPGGCMVGDPKVVELFERMPMTWREGDIYRQRPEEIHVSRPSDGSVTLLERQFGDDVDHAYVYFPVDQEWVSAEPRDATEEEVTSICAMALRRWFSD